MRAALLAGALLAGCGSTYTPTPSVERTVDWELEITREGPTLTAMDAAGPVFRMACRAFGPHMELLAYRFAPVPGLDAMLFGTDSDNGYLLAAGPALHGAGVRATATIFPPLLQDLLSAGGIGAVYGDQRLETIILPGEQTGAFVGSCLGFLP